MQGAPSVSYPVGRSLLAGALPLGLWAAGMCAAAMFWVSAASLPARAAAAAAALASGGLAAFAWRNLPRGSLHWDGPGWRLEGSAQATGPAAVGLDLQDLLLLRVGEGPSARWLWAEARRRPGLWGDLRRAVYSRASNLPSQVERPGRTAE